MKALPTIWLMYRAARTARMSAREVVRMVALVTLAGLSYGDASPTFRMHLGAARGTFRRSLARA